MIYRFLIVSGEADNFMREIKIDAEATFMDFYNAIIKSVAYTDDQMCSFVLCDDDWKRKTEVTLVDMGTSYEEDVYVMEDTKLEGLIDDDEQKMLFVFDQMSERGFFIELREIITGKTLPEAVCSRSEGLPPPQFVDYDAVESKISSNFNSLDENFYGDSEYEIDELDRDGFEGLDAIDEQSFDDDRY